MTFCAVVRRASGLFVFLTVTIFGTPAMSASLPSGAAPADQATQARLTEAYRSLSFSFEPNLGQSDALVKFLARTRGMTVFLTTTYNVHATGRTAVRVRHVY